LPSTFAGEFTTGANPTPPKQNGAIEEAGQVYPALILNKVLRKNVRVVSSNAESVTVSFEGGMDRVKRKDLPETLRLLYPVEDAAAAAADRERAEEAKRENEAAARANQGSFARRGAALEARLAALERQLADHQQLLATQNQSARGKPRSAARQTADEMRKYKMMLVREIQAVRQELEQHRMARAGGW